MEVPGGVGSPSPPAPVIVKLRNLPQPSSLDPDLFCAAVGARPRPPRLPPDSIGRTVNLLLFDDEAAAREAVKALHGLTTLSFHGLARPLTLDAPLEAYIVGEEATSPPPRSVGATPPIPATAAHVTASAAPQPALPLLPAMSVPAPPWGVPAHPYPYAYAPQPYAAYAPPTPPYYYYGGPALFPPLIPYQVHPTAAPSSPNLPSLYPPS